MLLMSIGNHERREPPRPAVEQNLELFGGGRQSADAGADDDSRFRRGFPCRGRGRNRAAPGAGKNAELRIAVRAADFLRRWKRGRRVKIFHLAGDLRVERRRVKGGDAVNAACAGDEVVPENIELMPERRHDAEAGDDHAAVCQVACHKKSNGQPELVQPNCPGRFKVATIFGCLRCIWSRRRRSGAFQPARPALRCQIPPRAP